MRIRFKILLPYVAVVAAALLLRLAYAPFAGQTTAAWFAPIPLFLVARLYEPRKAARFGFVFGFVFFACALTWFWPLVDNGGPWPIVLLGEIGLSAWCGLFPALAVYGMSFYWDKWRKLRAQGPAAENAYQDSPEDSPEEHEALMIRRHLRVELARREMGGPLVAAVFWAGSEWLRASIGGGFAWYTLGVSQISSLSILQLASIGGVYMVSALVALGGDAFAGVLLRGWDGLVHTPCATRRHMDLTIALVIVLVCFCWGTRHRKFVANELRYGPVQTLTAAAVNPEQPCVFNNNDAEWEASATRLAQATFQVTNFPPCTLVVWPESAMAQWGSLPSKSGKLEAALARWAVETGRPILAGGTRLAFSGGADQPATALYNGCWLFGENGIEGGYEKRHLVPFGEYIPLDKTFPVLQRLTPGGSSCTPGNGPVLIEVPTAGGDKARISPLICFEDTVPPVVRESAKGANVLVSVSNDAWFLGSCEAEQHQAEAVVRAVENGISLLRIGNSACISVVYPTGESNPGVYLLPDALLDLCFIGDYRVLSAPYLPKGITTVYEVCGDIVFGLPCALVVLFLCGNGLLKSFLYKNRK